LFLLEPSPLIRIHVGQIGEHDLALLREQLGLGDKF
jgi:hypothetical protein